MPMGEYEDFDDCVKKNQDKDNPEAYCGEIKKKAESTIQSTVLSETPRIEGNSVTLPIVKVGTKAYDAEGKEYTLTKCALESGAESWSGGIVTVNHKVQVDGTISKAWFEDPYVYATVEDLNQETIDAINSAAYRGVSQESQPITIDKNGNVTELSGTGTTFTFFPEMPACDMKSGCGVPIASTVADTNADEERHEFDIATTNNVGKLVKIREETVFLWGNNLGNPDALKERLTQAVGYIGMGVYKVFDRDDNLTLGDEIPGDREPVHTVTITVSNSPIFNFPLNTHLENSQLNSSGGDSLSEELENKITELKSTIESKDGEIGKLESENAKLKQELEAKDGQIKSTVEAAVKAVLEARDAEIAKQTEYDAAVKELSSFMKEDTLAEFMKSEPSVEIIKSTTTALKSTVHVGSGMGSNTPPDDVSTAMDELKASTGRN